jgi:3-hydroxyacyl-CoA dehydrogenase
MVSRVVGFLVRLGQRTRSERGDVPGWVLVTVMTAGLVTALWLVADDQLKSIFTSALGRVTGP